MIAEILSIGDELTNGIILDTNSQWLSRELAEIGISTHFHTTVNDDLAEMLDVMRIATERADLIIMTGGLGPTADDLTREAIAKTLELPLEMREELLEHVREIFRRRGREIPKANEVQAMQPRGAKAIPNPNGTAPGVDITVKRKTPKPDRLESFRIIALPGVPAEMREMWHGTVQDSLHEMIESITGEKKVIRVVTINTFGLGESQIEAMLPDLVNRSHYPKVGITASEATISLRIFGEGETEESCQEMMAPTRKIIYEKLGDLIFGEGTDRLQEIVCRILDERKKTLSVIEWGTRGLLSEAIAGAVGASERFLGGFVLNSLKSLENCIRNMNVTGPAELPIEGFSLEAAAKNAELNTVLVQCMARVALGISGSDYVLAVGPYPPSRARTDLVAIAFGTNERIDVNNMGFDGHPAIIDQLFMKRVMNKMRLTLERE